MKRLYSKAILVAAALITSMGVCNAQDNKVIIAPFAGYRLGGDLTTDFGGGDVSIEDSVSYGVKISFPIHSVNAFVEDTEVELIYSRQDSEISGESFGVTDVDFAIDNFLIGVKYHFYEEALFESPWIKPYASGDVGFTRFSSSDGDVEEDLAFALAGALGTDFYIGEHFGIFVDAAIYGSFVSSGSGAVCSSGRGCAFVFDGSSFWQGQFSVGALIRF